MSTYLDARGALPADDYAGQADDGPPATLRHDADAYARCSWCRRYSMDPLSLSHAQGQVPVCECGRADGWSGSFERPGTDAEWSKP